MLETENKNVRKIDEVILERLKRNLNVNKEKIDIIEKKESDKIITSLELKKEIIYLLFHGDFAVNEKMIEGALEVCKSKSTIYDTIANKLILNRVNQVIDSINNKNSHDGRIISVCYDRKFFIKKVMEKNVDISFIKKCFLNEEKTMEL